MTQRDYVKSQIDTLPQHVVERVMEFIAFQKFRLGYDDETDYLTRIPGMTEKIEAAAEELLSEAVTLSELWDDDV